MNEREYLTQPNAFPSCGTLLRMAIFFVYLLMGYGVGANTPPNTIVHSSYLTPPPNWTINPSNFQFNMNVVVRIRFNGVPDNTAGNIVGVFVGAELRGVATKTTIGSDTYYFVTVFSNQYTGETLNFRTYYANNDKVYASVETVVFTHHKLASTISQPIWINIDPTLDFPPQLAPILDDTTLQNIPFNPVMLSNYLISLDGDPVTWSAQPGSNLTASIVNGVLTVTPVSAAWIGTDTVRIIVTENTPNQKSAHITGKFTVLPDYGPPVFQTIPSQTIFKGGNFTPFDLDNYLTFNGPCQKFDFEVFPYTGIVAAPMWPVVPPAAQPMTIVARPLFANKQLAGPGARLAAFVNNTLVGWAGPTGVSPNVSYTLALQNLASGPITFKFYHADNQYLYEKITTIAFAAGSTVGSVAAPLEIQFSPLVPTLGVNGQVAVTVVDPNWVGTYPVNFIVRDCGFPIQRRDVKSVTFSVVVDNRPRITSPPTINFQENACTALYDAQTTDPNYSEGNGLTYSISGGADAAKFSINAVNGKLSWAINFTPNFEIPGDANGNNQYEVTILVTNTLMQTDDLMLVVTITDSAIESFLPQVNGGATPVAVCLVGTVVLQASGGNAYIWNNGDPNTSITVSTTGTYTVTVTNSGGCTGSVVVTVTNRPSITATAGSATICLGANISLSSTPVGGSGTYTTFAWAGPNSFAPTQQNPIPFPAAPIAAGTYTVTVTDNAGCSATATASVSVASSSAPSIMASSNSPICAGTNLLLSSIPTGGSGTYSQYKWAGPNYSASVQNPSGLTSTLLTAGTYTVTVTDNAGCTGTGTTVVLVNARPTITATSNTPLCTGKMVNLSSTPMGGSGTYTSFAWAGPGFTSTLEDPANFAATLAASGSYQVTMTDNNGCTATASTSLVVNEVPSITAALLSPVCASGTVNLGSAPMGGAFPYTFSWAGPNNYAASAEDPAAFPVTPAVAGAYTVTVTDLAGCTATNSVTAVVYSRPSITAMNNGPVCNGSNLMLSSTASLGSGDYTLFWTGPDAYVASVEDPVSFSSTSASMGTYQVKVTDSNGCTATATTAVTVKINPTITAMNNGPLCIGANISLQSTAMGGSGGYSTFAWSKSGGGYTAPQEDPPGFPATILSAGTYTVTVTDNAGCTATASTNVAISSNPAPSTTAMGNGPLCAGQNIQLSSSPLGGSNTYAAFQWTGPNAYKENGQNPTAFVATAAKSGVYTIKVTDSKGCFGTNSVTVIVNAPMANPTVNNPLCEGSTVLLNAGATGSTGGYTYNWQGPNSFSSMSGTPSGFPANSSTIGTYTVTVTDVLNCSSVGTVTVQFEINDPPTITCPTAREIPANSTCMATLGNWTTFATNVTDDCTPVGSITLTQSPAAGTGLSGHNDFENVTLTANDNTGNTTSCTFRVTLKDQTKPIIVCPDNTTIAADASCAGVVGTRILFSKSDNCTASAAITESQSPAASTPVNGHNATQTVTLVANDGNGNTQSCQFTVTLKDVSKPVITCPANVTTNVDEACSALVGSRILVSKSDNCVASVNISEMQSPAPNTKISGHNFVQTVTLTANDGNGNTATCSFLITLKDVTSPSITCPANVTMAADMSCAGTLTVYGAVALADNCTDKPTVVQAPALGTSITGHNFVQTVTLTANDGNGNTATCFLLVTLKDVMRPFIICPVNATIAANAACNGTIGAYTASLLTDNCTTNPAVNQTPLSSTILIGHNATQTVTLTANDGNGNTNSCFFSVTLKDVTPPLITCPASQTVSTALNLCTAVVNFVTPVASDNCTLPTNAVIQLPGTPVSGASFPKGQTTVVFRATDAAGLTKTCTLRVTVNDVQAPIISCPGNQSVNTTAISCSSAPVNYATPTATDNCTPAPTVVRISGLASGAVFPIGTTNVTWRAIDGVGRSATCTFSVVVTDNTPPTIICPSNIAQNNPSTACNTPVVYPTPTATDNCAVTALYLFNGLGSGSVFPMGVTTNTWRAVDANNNSVNCSFTVTVTCNVVQRIWKTKMDMRNTNFLKEELNLSLAPNPAASEVRFEVIGLSDKAGELLVFDGLGRVLLRQQLAPEQSNGTFNVSALPEGLYRVILRTEKRTVAQNLVVMPFLRD